MSKFVSSNDSKMKNLPKKVMTKAKPKQTPKKVLKFKPGNDLAGKV
ncbi:MAG: hypothetical protein WCO13_12625 [Bacteroidota bacterium]